MGAEQTAGPVAQIAVVVLSVEPVVRDGVPVLNGQAVRTFVQVAMNAARAAQLRAARVARFFPAALFAQDEPNDQPARVARFFPAALFARDEPDDQLAPVARFSQVSGVARQALPVLLRAASLDR